MTLHPITDVPMTPAQAHALRRATPLNVPVLTYSPRPVPSADGIADATDDQLLAMAAANGVLSLDRWLMDLAAEELEARGVSWL